MIDRELWIVLIEGLAIVISVDRHREGVGDQRTLGGGFMNCRWRLGIVFGKLGSKSSGEFGHFTGTIDEFRRRHAEAIHHGDKEIGERDVGLEKMIGTMVETEAITSRQDERVVGVVMSGAVAAAVKNHGVVEKSAFVFAGVLQALEEI